MLEFRKLSSGYAEEIVHDVSFSCPSGCITAILGPNGCGKSTLLKTVFGLAQRRGGQILLDGQDITACSPRELALQCAYLPQSRNIPAITARRMVLHGRFAHLSYPRRYQAEDYAAVDAAMEQLGISQLRDIPLTQLSGGQRQQVYLAVALAQQVPVILMDEPITYLDVRHQLSLMETAHALAAEGKTLVMVLHDLSLALRCADRIALMEHGCLRRFGSAEEVFSSGALSTVFGIRLNRVQTDSGWQYFPERTV